MSARLVVAVLLLATSGCAEVRPWQREVLTLPIMQLDAADPLTHAQDSREGSAGGAGAVGESCGCN